MKDYILAIIAGISTGILFIFVVLNIQIQIPYVKIILPVVIPIIWTSVIFTGRLLKGRLPWAYQFSKFFVVGFLNFSIDFGILNLGSLLTGIYSGKGLIPINFISSSTAITNSFLWNRYWTFSRKGKPVFREVVIFVGVTLMGTAINTGIVYGTTTFMPLFDGLTPPLLENAAKIAASAVTLGWNFIGYRLFVFKDSDDTDKVKALNRKLS
jgi:putative flippase GtrA